MQHWLVAGGLPPIEYEMMVAVRRYGAQAVMGRPLGIGEIRKMIFVENMIAKYQADNAKDKDNG